MNKVGFSVSGEFITSHARDLILSKKHNQAYQFLRESFDPFPTWDQVFSILSGEMEFVGNSIDGINLIEKTNQAYIDQLNQLWAGSILICDCCTVAKESNITIVRLADAKKLFSLGDEILVDMEHKTIKIIRPKIDAVP